MIFKHQRQAIEDERESHLVVPGLTDSIASDIHKYLQQEREKMLQEEQDNEQDKTVKVPLCYLLREKDPVEEDQIITAAGLVSIRTSSSFVIVASPDQFSNIPESIIGSGGVIRVPVYPENAPWAINKSDIFSFEEEILNNLFLEWGVDSESQQEWFNEFIFKIAIDCTKNLENREDIFLDKILNQFDFSIHPEIPIKELKMLYHIGIPKLGYTQMGDIGQLKREMKSLYAHIDKRLKEQDIRQQVTDRVPVVYADSSAQKIEEAQHHLDTFLDSLMNRPFSDNNLLGFFGCWNSIEQWNVLTAEKLRDLFEIPRNRVKIKLKCQLSGEKAIVSEDEKSLATFYGEDIKMHISWDIPEPALPATISLKRGRRILLEPKQIDELKGQIDWEITVNSQIGNHNSSIPLTLVLTPAEREKPVSIGLRIHVCGPTRECYALIPNGMHTLDSSNELPDEPIQSIEIDSPTDIYIFSWDGKRPDYGGSKRGRNTPR